MMNHAPSWSPTANLIVFDSDRDGGGDVYAIDPDRGTVRRLTDHPAADGSAHWSPDGKFILFQSDREGRLRMHRMRADGSGQEPLEEDEWQEHAVSRDGRRVIVAATRGGYTALFGIDGGGRPMRQLTTGTQASQPSFSPDGSMLVYESLPLNGDFLTAAIVVMNPDGSRPRRVADGTDPSWSPDGALLLFKTPTGHPGGWGWEIATIQPDGSSFARLVPGVHPTWSPDGQRIAFMVETHSQRSDIWIVQRDGSGARCLTCHHRGAR